MWGLTPGSHPLGQYKPEALRRSKMWNYSFKEHSVAVQCVQVSPCLQVKGQIFVERRCQSSPSCQSCRRCLLSLGWQKHPAETSALSVAQAGRVWTCTRGHLDKRAGAKCWGQRAQSSGCLLKPKKVPFFFLPPRFRSSSTFSDRILTFFFLSSCMITLLLGAGWHTRRSIHGNKN